MARGERKRKARTELQFITSNSHRFYLFILLLFYCHVQNRRPNIIRLHRHQALEKKGKANIQCHRIICLSLPPLSDSSFPVNSFLLYFDSQYSSQVTTVKRTKSQNVRKGTHLLESEEFAPCQANKSEISDYPIRLRL